MQAALHWLLCFELSNIIVEGGNAYKKDCNDAGIIIPYYNYCTFFPFLAYCGMSRRHKAKLGNHVT